MLCGTMIAGHPRAPRLRAVIIARSLREEDSMADPNAGDDDANKSRTALTEAIADGFELFRQRDAERRAKEEAEKGDDNDAPAPKSFIDRLLGN